MTHHTRHGFRRLAIAAAILTGAAALVLLVTHIPPDAIAWRVALVVPLLVGLAAAAAWGIVRLIAWVVEGFAPLKKSFPEPGKN